MGDGRELVEESIGEGGMTSGGVIGDRDAQRKVFMTKGFQILSY